MRRRFSADSIEASDIEISGSIAGPAGGRVTYKMPRIVVKDYSGPASLPPRPASASIIEAYRSALEQFATVSASSITAPTIAGTINNFGTVTSAEFAYTGVALREIKNGKIASTQIERNAFTANTQQAGKPDKLTGEIAQFRFARFRRGRRCRHPRSATGQRRQILPRLRSDDGRALHHYVGARPAHAHRRDDHRRCQRAAVAAATPGAARADAGRPAPRRRRRRRAR